MKRGFWKQTDSLLINWLGPVLDYVKALAVYAHNNADHLNKDYRQYFKYIFSCSTLKLFNFGLY